MPRFIPDWFVYALALGAVVWAVFSVTPDNDVPPPTPDAMEEEGAILPPPSAFDERVLVQVEAPRTGIGTAFSINENGQWLTARHVVEGCDELALLVAPGRYLKIAQSRISDDSDLALLETSPGGSTPVALDTDADLRVGSLGFHVGYPQGRPGEAVARLVSRSNLISNGIRSGSEPVLAWAETGRTRGLSGSLGGLSGGPVYDSEGRVRGVIIAESPKRGRIYTASPEAVEGFLDDMGVQPRGDMPKRFSSETYGRDADRARRDLQVAKVACHVEEEHA